MEKFIDEQQQKKKAENLYLCPLDHCTWIWINHGYLKNPHGYITCQQCGKDKNSLLMCQECKFTICQKCRPSKHNQFCNTANWVISYKSPKKSQKGYCSICENCTHSFQFCTCCQMFQCFNCNKYSHGTFCQDPKFIFSSNPQGSSQRCNFCATSVKAYVICSECKFIVCVNCRKSKQWK